MTLKKKTIWLFSVLILFASVFLCGVLGIGAGATGESTPKFSDVQIASEYKVGDEWNVPTASFTQDGEEYACTSVIIMPDGSAVQKDTIVFEKSGNYSVLYKAIINGKYVEKKISFTVINDLYSVSSNKSSASWGFNSYFEESIPGINLSLKPEDVFTFNQVIDVSKLTRNDMICKFYITPLEKGSPEASNMYIKLTDIYDPDNYVLVNYSMYINEMSWSYNYIYASAGANGQSLIGLLWRDFTKYDVHANSWAGLQSWVSYTGIPKAPLEVRGNPELEAKYSRFEENYDYLSMDYANRVLYAKSQNVWRDYSKMTDLDDPELYGSNCWDGFTTGEVRMSIYFENYVGASANIFITDIANYDLTKFNFTDSVAPIIDVDYDGYTQETLPKAFVGQPYKLFAGKAIDNLDEIVELKTSVYYNYYSNARTQVYVENGYFTPKYAGKYVLVYSATDVMGNETLELAEIDCLQPDKTVKLTVKGQPKAISIGESVRLNDYEVGNNNGSYDVKIEAVLKSDESVRYEIDLATMTFNPAQTGEFEIRYTVQDYTHTFTAKDLLTVNKSDTPIIGTYSEFPAYLIKGCQYTFDKATAYDYSNGMKVEIPADYYVIEDNAPAKKADNNTFTVSATKTVEVVCKANNGKGEMNESVAVLPVVDVNYGTNVRMMNYFQGKGFVISATEQAVRYTKEFDGAREADLEFINQTLINQFTFTVSFPDGCTNFETFDVCLTDALDVKNALKVSFKLESNNTVAFWVNDFTQKIYRVGYVGSVANLNFYYQKSTNSLLINNNLTVRLGGTGLFNGFDGGFANFKVQFTGVTGKVGISVSHVCNQPFNKGMDTIKPVIYMAERTPNLVEIGTEFAIKRAYAFDLLDSNATLAFKLMNSKGTFIESVDGVLLDGTQDPNRDYTVVLNEYGRYALQYVSVDCAGNRYDVQNLITVQDSVGPEIVLEKNYRTQAKLGDKITVAKAQISDNVEGDIAVRCYVIVPNRTMLEVALGGTFTATEKGEYQVYYYAVDKTGNVEMVSYTIRVS